MRNDPLSPTLHGINYLVQQIGAALVEERYGQMALSNISTVISALERFRSGLVKRYGEARGGYDVDHVIEGLHMLERLYPATSRESSLRYRIVAEGIRSEFKTLEAMAQDTDQLERTELSLSNF